jgi:hypothetical protein
LALAQWWHAGETVVALAKHYHLTLRVGADDPGCVGDVGWPGKIALDILICTLSPLSIDELRFAGVVATAPGKYIPAEQPGAAEKVGFSIAILIFLSFARFDVANAFWF